MKKGRKGVGNGRLSTGLDPQCPQEYIDSVYIGTTLTDGRFIGQSPSFAWPSYYSLRLIKDENGIIIIPAILKPNQHWIPPFMLETSYRSCYKETRQARQHSTKSLPSYRTTKLTWQSKRANFSLETRLPGRDN